VREKTFKMIVFVCNLSKNVDEYFAPFFPGHEISSQAEEKMKCNNCDRKFNPFYDCWCRRGVWSEDKIEKLRKKHIGYIPY